VVTNFNSVILSVKKLSLSLLNKNAYIRKNIQWDYGDKA